MKQFASGCLATISVVLVGFQFLGDQDDVKSDKQTTIKSDGRESLEAGLGKAEAKAKAEVIEKLSGMSPMPFYRVEFIRWPLDSDPDNFIDNKYYVAESFMEDINKSLLF